MPLRPAPFVALAGALALAGSAARAQEEARPSPDGCVGRAALYAAEAGPAKMWVLRHGSLLMAENPLRPLSRDRALVLQVVVNGRVATAYGPDPDNLRQGGAPTDVERLGAEPIRWTDGAEGRPASLRVVADDGTVLLGPLRFVDCADAPTARPVAVRRPERPAAPANEKRRAGDVPRPERAIPQGAIPQGAVPGLALPPPTSR